MPCSRSRYPLLRRCLQSLAITTHHTSTTALAHLVTALLVAQSLRPTPLARALLRPGGPGGAALLARVLPESRTLLPTAQAA